MRSTHTGPSHGIGHPCSTTLIFLKFRAFQLLHTMNLLNCSKLAVELCCVVPSVLLETTSVGSLLLLTAGAAFFHLPRVAKLHPKVSGIRNGSPASLSADVFLSHAYALLFCSLCSIT